MRLLNENHQLLDDIPVNIQQNFQTEARAILESDFFQWFLDDLTLFIEREMYKKSSTDEGWWHGKGMLYMIDKMYKNVRDMAESDLPIKDKREKKLMRRFLK